MSLRERSAAARAEGGCVVLETLEGREALAISVLPGSGKRNRLVGGRAIDVRENHEYRERSSRAFAAGSAVQSEVWGSRTPSGLAPAQLPAYGINNIRFSSIVGDGAGQTIAIVDAMTIPGWSRAPYQAF